MKILITGRPNSGKTKFINSLNISAEHIFIGDKYVHECLYLKKQKGYKLIEKFFGKDFVNEKEVDRKKIGDIIAKDASNLTLLNKIIFPLIYKELKKKKYKVVEVPGISFINTNINFDRQFLFNEKNKPKHNSKFIKLINNLWDQYKVTPNITVVNKNNITKVKKEIEFLISQ